MEKNEIVWEQDKEKKEERKKEMEACVREKEDGKR